MIERTGRGPARWGRAAVGSIVLLAACTGVEPGLPAGVQTEQADPCPDVVAVDLGVPKRTGRFAEFTLASSAAVWVTATGFPHGGPFDPEVGRTAVYLGSQDALPTYDESSSTVTDAVVDTDVVEDTWTEVELDAGGHWLWTSAGVTVSVKTCDGPPPSDVVRAPPG